mmetsp:Transcript_17878/g.38306  ORF Transcript_17878/g.38306 Transcript_17878/m.38306 type:complete len:184 (-) Transcript_17878:238-789(-)
MAPAGKFEEYSKAEVSMIESELKDWFLHRRFSMERNMAIKKALDENNFMGLSMANSSTPEAQKAMWSDLVTGKPELEDSLSTNAKQMKADMYTKMFKDATDYDHPCRVPGSEYLQCVSSNYKDASKSRQLTCQSLFSTFQACRSATLEAQSKALESSLMKQDIADRRAKALFERRATILGSKA